MCFLFVSNDNMLSVEDSAEHVENTGSKILNYYKVDGAWSKLGGAKNIRCIFCANFLTGCRAVLAQMKANENLVFEYVKMMIFNRHVSFMTIGKKAGFLQRG